MGMSIQVNDFHWEPGRNDAEYIKLLKSSRDEWRKIAQKAITKLKTLSKAQKPKMITDADFLNNPNMDSQGYVPAWIEYRRDDEWFEYWNDTADEWSLITANNYKSEGYRCWTSQPTDEQKEATAWT